MKRRVILIQSKPGLGKSTLARSVVAALTARRMKAVHLSLGDRLRAISRGEIRSNYAYALREYSEMLAHHGILDDPDIIHGIALEALDQLGADVTIIDGYPRYPRLVDGFIEHVEAGEIDLVRLVVLDGSDAFASQRMQDRGRTLSGVTEDMPERLATHAVETEPAIERLEERFGALHLDAHLPLAEKTAAVVSCIETPPLV